MPVLVQLTSTGATVPYGICIDPEQCIWVAAKGGLFRFNPNGHCLLADKHEHPKRISAFSSVRYLPGRGEVLVKYADADGCFLTVYDLTGVRKATSLLDNPVKSVAVTDDGDIFLTSHCQPNVHQSEILRGHVDDLTSFVPILSSDQFQFDQLCCCQEKQLLVVSCAQLPSNPYSQQYLSFIKFDGEQIGNFSSSGTEEGQIQWPRAMEVSPWGSVIVLDKTGRLQEFSLSDGNYIRLIGTIPTGLANSFCIDNSNNRVLVICSGLVYSDGDWGRAECNDWIECLPL